MKTFINKVTGVHFEVEDAKAEWFEKEADFTEHFEEPEVIVITPKKKQVKVEKAKVHKRVLKKDKE